MMAGVSLVLLMLQGRGNQSKTGFCIKYVVIMKINERSIVAKIVVSECLQYHLENGISLQDCVMRLGSDAYNDIVCEVRRLYNAGQIELSASDRVIVAKLQTGVKAKWQGRTVTLDSPQRNSENPKKKFIVYHNSGKRDKDGNIIAKKIEWGDPNLDVENADDKKRKSFLARMQCSLKTDQGTAGWWACNVHLFHKQLGLQSDKPW